MSYIFIHCLLCSLPISVRCSFAQSTSCHLLFCTGGPTCCSRPFPLYVPLLLCMFLLCSLRGSAIEFSCCAFLLNLFLFFSVAQVSSFSFQLMILCCVSFHLSILCTSIRFNITYATHFLYSFRGLIGTCPCNSL